MSNDLNKDKIAQIRAKLLSNRRTRVKAEDDESKTTSLGLGDLEVNRESRDIFSRERVWRTRTTILQSTGKTFNKTVTATLSSIKAREEGKIGGGGKSMMPPPSATPRPSGGSMPPPPARTQLPNYNRYDQEQFHGKDTHGFNIDTQQTFSGMTLKSVTEGNQAQRNKQMQQMQQKTSSGGGGGNHTPNISGGGTGTTPKTGSASPGGGSNSKRPSRTPIIIIPAAPKSLVTMYNAKDVLQDLR